VPTGSGALNLRPDPGCPQLRAWSLRRGAVGVTHARGAPCRGPGDGTIVDN